MLALRVCALILALGATTQALDNGLALTPPMGWLTWERFRCQTDCQKYPDSCISEKLIKQMADAMASEGYADVGYEYVIIDDCWPLRDRDADGRIVADPDRFPSGIKSLAQYVHSKGLKFGIYGDIGTLTCAGYPGTRDYMEIDANTFAEWEVDYLKIDGCWVPDANDFEIIYPQFGDFLNKTGRPIVYSCEWSVYQQIPNVNFTALSNTCNLWRNYNDIDDSYESFRNNIVWQGNNQDSFADYARPGAWNDPDMLLIGNFGLSFVQAKAQMAAWAVMASPLIMSNDLRNMDPQMKAILQNKAVIQVNQDRLGKQGKRVSNEEDIHIWVRPIEPVVNGATSYAVALISTRTDGTPHNVQVSLDSIGVNSSSKFNVTELFNALPASQMNKGDSLNVDVPPTGVIFLKFEVSN